MLQVFVLTSLRHYAYVASENQPYIFCFVRCTKFSSKPLLDNFPKTFSTFTQCFRVGILLIFAAFGSIIQAKRSFEVLNTNIKGFLLKTENNGTCSPNSLKELRHGWSSSSFAIRLNLLHPQPSLFLFGLLLPIWCFSTFVNCCFEAIFNLRVLLHCAKMT